MLSCVRHCSIEKATFYFGPQPLPCDGICTLCSRSFRNPPENAEEAPILVAPFILPCPFVQPPQVPGSTSVCANYYVGVRKTKTSRGRAIPMSLLLRPSTGSFLGSYTDGDTLHIGIVNSTGDMVVHFDEAGVHRDVWNTEASASASQAEASGASPWLLAINISMADDPKLGTLATVPGGLWDGTLDKEAGSANWDSSRFHFQANNCYDFVLACLARIAKRRNGGQLDSATAEMALFDKDGFSEHCLLAVAKRAGHYIDLYRKVSNSASGCVVVDRASC